MFLENPKTGTLGIVHESAISEKTVPVFFFAKKKCYKTKLHELYIAGKILYTSDFNLLFFGEIDPPTRLAISLHTAVKNEVRCAEKTAIAVF